MVRLRTCTAADTALLVQALNECLYQGYRFKVVMTAKRFVDDGLAHDVDLGATYLAIEDEQPVGVALAARRGERAWIAGMGVHPSRRGQGLGTRLLRTLQERLRALGVSELLLEVLVDNVPARRAYDRAGFVARRGYSCFRGVAGQAGPPGALSVARHAPASIIARHATLHEAEQCWQRDPFTLEKRRGELLGHVATVDRETVGAILTSESAIQDVGRSPEGPPIAELLPALLHKAFGPARPFAIVNVPEDDPLHGAMRAAGFEVYAEQLDMRCAL